MKGIRMAADDVDTCPSGGGEGLAIDDLHLLRHLEPRPFRPFKSSEEYLYAMKEDLAEWLNSLYDLDINVDNFMDRLETGVILCKHANHVLHMARDWHKAGHNGVNMPIPDRDVVYRTGVMPGTFHARDNVSNFITWCRSLAIKDCLLFETEDLVMRKNERSFILCLLEVARRGAMFGMPAPLLVQMEQEIDAELAKGGADSDGHEADDDSDTYSEPRMQIITNDLRSLHERVVDLLNRCTCPSQFPMIRVADGRYRIGDTKVLIFVRILRNHVMVRVGGGWDTLEHYLDKHDPCRCRSGHRFSTSAKLSMSPGKYGPQMQVTYNRSTIPGLVRGDKPASVPTSPQVRRRSSHQEMDNRDYPIRGPSRNSHCSDDSSASSTSVNTRDDSPTPRIKTNGCPRPMSAESSSEVSEGEGRTQGRRRSVPRKTSRGSVDYDEDPLYWRYSQGSRPSSQDASSIEELNQYTGRRRSTCDDGDTKTFKSRIPCLDPPARKLSCYQKAQSSEDLYTISFNGRRNDHHYNSYSRGASPNQSPVKGRRASTGTGSMPRSQSQTYDELEDNPVLSRQGPGRYSCRNLRMSDPRPKVDTGNKTWTFRQRSPRPSVVRETYRLRKSPATTPKLRSPENPSIAVSSPVRSKQISPLLEEMLRDDNLDSDEKILERMELLINQYKKKMENGKPSLDDESDQRGNTRKDSMGMSPSKIPLRTWRN